MTDYVFKTYIADGKEYFEYGAGGNHPRTKKDFPFPESLLRILYLDMVPFQKLTSRFEHSWRSLIRTREERYADEMREVLNELAKAHIFFELTRLDWRERLAEATRRHYEDTREQLLVDLLPRKQVTRIPGLVTAMQEQVKRLFAVALDADGDKRPVSEKMVAYYEAKESERRFQFQPQPMSFEVVDRKTFAEVLYPKDVYDLVDYFVRECVKRETRMRVCKSCGHWFALTGHVSTEYCEITRDERGHTCKERGAIKKWAQSKRGDEVFHEYRREYKRRFAWIRAGRITEQAFYDWSAEARAKKAECEAGAISFDEFKDWLART